MANVTVTLDETLLERIDRKADAEGMTRSAYLARAVERELNSKDAGTSADSDGNADGIAADVSRTPEMQAALDGLREMLRRYRTSERHGPDPTEADGPQLTPGPGVNPAVSRALDDARELLAHAPAGDSTAIIRAERDARTEHIARLAGPAPRSPEAALKRLQELAKNREMRSDSDGSDSLRGEPDDR